MTMRPEGISNTSLVILESIVTYGEGSWKKPRLDPALAPLMMMMNMTMIMILIQWELWAILTYLLYGTTAIDELRPPSNEGFFI